MKRLSKYVELFFWITALALLASMPTGTDPHYSFCLFKFMGIDFCPGCGLGHSISYLFHGEIYRSLQVHPLGIFAVVVILLRIYKLISIRIFGNYKIYNNG